MSESGLEVFDTTLQKTNAWLKELMVELSCEDRHRAYLALRATLHAVRDRLNTGEAVQLGAQLPMLIRGFYYEGWNPAHTPIKARHRADFLHDIERSFAKDLTIDAAWIARAVFKLLESRVSHGEIADVRHVLPSEIRELWPASSHRAESEFDNVSSPEG
jgi:uncharacterized protein (DUF2267 family)